MTDEVRRCYVCLETKPRGAFSAGVRDFMCRECRKGHDKARGFRGSGGNHSENGRARKRRWQSANADPVKQAARLAVRNAIKSAQLIPKPCEECGVDKKRVDGARAVQAHHDDYSKPLVIRWLCAKCHTAWHKTHDAAMRQEAGND